MLRFRGFQKPIFAEREEITHNSLKSGKNEFEIFGENKLENVIFEFPENLGQGVHRKPMATHKTVTFVTSNMLLYFTAFRNNNNFILNFQHEISDSILSWII